MSSSLNETTIEVTGRWIVETDKAIRFLVYKVGIREMIEPTPYWFLFSQVSSLNKQPLGSDKLDTLRIKEWLLLKSGIYEKLRPAWGVPLETPKLSFEFDDDIPF